MSTTSFPRFACGAGTFLLAVLLAGCAGSPVAQVAPTAPPAPAIEPTTVPTTSSAASNTTAAPITGTPVEGASATAPAVGGNEDEIKAGIQQTLDLYAKAYNDNNPDLLKQAADQTNAPFRRFIQTRFDNYQQSIFAGQGTFAYTVKSITPRDFGFVEAQVQQDRYVADWTFRQLNGTWVMSEPTEAQLGKQEKIESEHFTFYTYPWADNVNQELIKLMENARTQVSERLGKAPDQKANVYIKPIFGVGKAENPNTLAYYSRSSNPKAPDRMVIFAPHSYVFQLYDPATGWEPELQGTLTHEYTHLVNNRLFTPIARMNDWMSEGLAEFVSDNPRKGEVSEAIRADHIIPIMDTSGQVNKQDLEHLTILEKASDISLGYGFAYSLVAYINEKYGGMDGFWKVVQAYDKSQNFDTALQQAFGVSYKQFDQDWRNWLKEKY